MAKRKQNAAGIPSGFTNFAGGSDGKAWEPAVGQTLHGICVGKRTIEAKKAGRQNAKKGETVTIVSVADKETGEVFAVWESYALREWCKNVKPKNEVFLRLDAVKKSGKKRFKDFTAAIKGAK